MTFIRNSVYFGMVLTFVAYEFGLLMKRKFRTALVNPVVIASIIVGAVLVLGKFDYEKYSESVKYITYFLTPATVCLAIPL